ncbi:MAG: hypothetical protein ACR650_04845 [Methylocystis sp.]
MRRLVVMSFGFVIAAGAGAVFLVVSALFDPATREAGLASVMAGLFAMLDEAFNEGDPADAVAAIGFVIWAAIVATCAAPLAVAALVGEAAGARSIVWYSGVSGVLAGASPWIVRASKGLERAHSASAAEGRLALLFFLTGALTGAIYWLIAAPARKEAAGESRSP